MRAVLSDCTISRWSTRSLSFTAVFAQETDCYKTVGFSRFNRLEKIGAIARCRDRDEDVTFLSMLDLAAEDGLKAIVVGYGCKRRGIGG